MLSHPATYWAKFYLTRQTHTYEQVEGLLNVNEVGGLRADELEELDQQMDYPVPFKPRDLRHRPSQAFLRREGIYEAWHRGRDMKIALGILENRELRQVVETMILSPVKPEAAVRKINRKLNVSLTVRAYELFKHYFWNRDLMSGAEWGEFLHNRDDAHQEWLQLAVDARGPGGVQMLLWKTGMGALRQIEANRVFSDLRNVAYMCAMQIAMDRPSKDHARMLLDYAKTAKLGQDGIDASADAVSDVVQAFSAFRMRHVESKTPTIQQLTGGNFSDAETAAGDEEKLEY